MSNHLKRFTNHNNYNAHISTGTAVLPNVCVCDNESEIHYNELKLITFTIDSVQYQAEEGMTWGDWVNSKYNTGGFYVENESGYYLIYFPNGKRIDTDPLWSGIISDPVFKNTVIINNGKYVYGVVHFNDSI